MKAQIRSRTKADGTVVYSPVIEMWIKGERKIKSGGTFATYREADLKGLEMEKRYESATEKKMAFAADQTLEQWVEKWLSELTIAASSIDTYTYQMKKYILPVLGHHQLRDLDTDTIQEWLDNLTVGHRMKSTLRTLLSGCMKAAIRFVPINPVKAVVIKETHAQRRTRKESQMVKVWTLDESTALLNGCIGLKIEPVIILGLQAGMRPGEIRALKKENVDILNSQVNVCENVTRAGGKLHHNTYTKGGGSRLVTIPNWAMWRLLEVMERTEGDRVFPIQSHGHANRLLDQLCRQVGVDYKHPHCLRHTNASQLLMAGVPIEEVAHRLGDSIQTIDMYYHHFIPGNEMSTQVLERLYGVPSIPIERANSDLGI